MFTIGCFLRLHNELLVSGKEDSKELWVISNQN